MLLTIANYPYKSHMINVINLTTKKQTTKFSSANFQKMLSSNIILRIQKLVDLDEMAHYEPPHQDLRCLQIQLFSSLVLKELKCIADCAGTLKMYSPSCIVVLLGQNAIQSRVTLKTKIKVSPSSRVIGAMGLKVLCNLGTPGGSCLNLIRIKIRIVYW